MGFNYAHEYKLFLDRWKRLRIKYRMAGMTEDAIDSLFEFDYEEFKSNRRFYRYLYSDLSCPPDKILQAVTVTDDLSSYHSRYWWIDEIDNPMILAYLCRLSKRNIELITLCIYEGYEQKEAAEILGLSESTVSYRLTKIKKIIKNISDFRI